MHFKMFEIIYKKNIVLRNIVAKMPYWSIDTVTFSFNLCLSICILSAQNKCMKQFTKVTLD